MPYSFSNARRIARLPAPPLYSSVMSISKRMIVVTKPVYRKVAACGGRLAALATAGGGVQGRVHKPAPGGPARHRYGRSQLVTGLC